MWHLTLSNAPILEPHHSYPSVSVSVSVLYFCGVFGEALALMWRREIWKNGGLAPGAGLVLRIAVCVCFSVLGEAESSIKQMYCGNKPF